MYNTNDAFQSLTLLVNCTQTLTHAHMTVLDDQTCGSVSRIKKFQFVPALFGAVVVAITCILTLATCVHTDPAAVLHPTLGK